jgi:beta-galactosidase
LTLKTYKQMKTRKIVLSVAFAVICFVASAQERIINNFDADWRFLKDSVAGAEQVNFDDSGWRIQSVPHDWSVETALDRSYPSGRGSSYMYTGVGWYRKSFEIPEEQKGKLFSIEFDGVMANSFVWVNGHLLGNRPYGYSSFSYDMTPYLKYGKGQKNIVAVKVDYSKQPSSRWYSGAGIYRHVRIVAKAPTSIGHWGVFVTTPEITGTSATVKIVTTVNNKSNADSKIAVQTTLLNPKGRKAGTAQSEVSLKAGESRDVEQLIKVSNPQLWNLESPNLYQAKSEILSGKKLVDDVTTSFGIRTAVFKAESGFWLNGKNIKIQGVCLHQDGGGLGIAVPLRVWEYRLNILRTIGVNGIRTAHNPMDPGFLDLCDRMGFVVMDETFDCWEAGKNTNDYHIYFKDWWDEDTRMLVMRDRNHPSVVIYSVGNEVRENLRPDKSGWAIYKKQQDLIHSLDSTRPVTMALFRPNTQDVYSSGFAEMMDVVGQNYRENELVAAHEQNPNRIVIGTENTHVREAALALRDKPYMSGQFLWAGIDYFGEGFWPAIFSSQGVTFRTGAFKARSYQRQSWWSKEPMIAAARQEPLGNSITAVTDWNPRKDADTAKVEVYTNCEEAELFINGRSLGKQKNKGDLSELIWTLPYEKGVVKAIGRNGGKDVAHFEIRSAETPVRLVLTADKPTAANCFEDVVYVRASLVDAHGTVYPAGERLITFDIKGAGKIVAVDDDNVNNHEIFQTNQRTSYLGSAVAIIRATGPKGTITVRAKADGVESGSVSIKAVPSPEK